MFGKLLKYDFIHYFKLWLIGAVTSIVMSFVGGFCISRLEFLQQQQYRQTFLILMFVMVILASVVCIIAFSVLNTILVCMRYAKNCYSDEAYLTFTLPVKRSTIFNSKFVNSIIYGFLTFVVTVMSVFTMLTIGCRGWMSDFLWSLRAGLRLIIDETGVYFPAYILITAIIVILSFLFNLSIVYFCITVAGIKVRKNKVLAGVGIYYLISIILGFVSQTGVYVIGCISEVSANSFSHPVIITLISILAVWLFGIVCAFYFYQLNLLDKKLNLA